MCCKGLHFAEMSSCELDGTVLKGHVGKCCLHEDWFIAQKQNIANVLTRLSTTSHEDVCQVNCMSLEHSADYFGRNLHIKNKTTSIKRSKFLKADHSRFWYKYLGSFSFVFRIFEWQNAIFNIS